MFHRLFTRYVQIIKSWKGADPARVYAPRNQCTLFVRPNPVCCENELPKERKKEKGAVQTMTLYYNTTIWLYKINLREEWRRKRERK